jgi:mediator of RNA polymerase II transcription subunit 17
MGIIDEMAREIQDPQIAAHISSISSATESIIRVTIAFIGHDMLNRSSFLLHVGSHSAKAICKDGRVIALSYDEQQLRDFILCQVAQHYIVSVQTSAKSLGWQILSLNNHIGVGDLEPLGNAVGALLASPYHDRVMCIRCGPASGLRVYVQHCSAVNGDKITATSPVSAGIVSNLWGQLSRTTAARPLSAALAEPWKAVNLSKVDGRNFVQKIETVMACLMPDRSASDVHFC